MKTTMKATMMTDCTNIDRIGPTKRPPGRSIGYQSWRDLLFVHWRVPAAVLEPHLPRGLYLDTWQGDCWVGLVPFRMCWVRPAGLPALPYISFFLETNLRIYVHDGNRPGVWFISLEASRWIAVTIARLKWCLNYSWSRMGYHRHTDRVLYQSQRWLGAQPAKVHVDACLGKSDTAADGSAGSRSVFRAESGSLEHFLAERYVLFTVLGNRGLHWGQVHHEPYPLHNVSDCRVEQSLSEVFGIPGGSPEHVMYSAGVDVEIFPLAPIT